MSSTRDLVSAVSSAARSVVGELALLLDGGEHRRAALVEFAQVAESLLERAELAVVEAAGDLLAVPRDERHGRALVEQPDGGGHLRFPDGQFLSETGIYGLDGRARSHARTLPNASDGSRGHSGACSGETHGCRATRKPAERRPARGAVQPVLGHQHQRDPATHVSTPAHDGPGAREPRPARPTTAAGDAPAGTAAGRPRAMTTANTTARSASATPESGRVHVVGVECRWRAGRTW